MTLEVTIGGRCRTVTVSEGPDGLAVSDDGRTLPVRLEPVSGSECWRLWIDGEAHPVRLRAEAGRLLAVIGAARVELAVRRALPIPSRRAGAAAGADRVEVRAPMPGLVVRVAVDPGATVAPGAVVAVVEAMKMQMEVPAPVAGRVAEVRARPGQEVAGGQVLAVMSTADVDGEGGVGHEP